MAPVKQNRYVFVWTWTPEKKSHFSAPKFKSQAIAEAKQRPLVSNKKLGNGRQNYDWYASLADSRASAQLGTSNKTNSSIANFWSFRFPI